MTDPIPVSASGIVWRDIYGNPAFPLPEGFTKAVALPEDFSEVLLADPPDSRLLKMIERLEKRVAALEELEQGRLGMGGM